VFHPAGSINPPGWKFSKLRPSLPIDFNQTPKICNARRRSGPLQNSKQIDYTMGWALNFMNAGVLKPLFQPGEYLGYEMDIRSFGKSSANLH
jgi:hypothetical protein